MTPKPTQLKTIEQELLKGSVIDSVIAFEKYHITRLSSIIQRLRKKGLPIISTKKENSSLACYSLAETGKGESEYNASGGQGAGARLATRIGSSMQKHRPSQPNNHQQ